MSRVGSRVIEPRFALMSGGRVLPLTTSEAQFVHEALRGRLRAVGRALDFGEAVDDEEDHRLRIEAGALARTVHMLRTSTFPVRDSERVAAWRRRVAQALLIRARPAGEPRPAKNRRVTLEITCHGDLDE